MSINAPKRRSGVRVRDDAGAALPQRPYLNAGTNITATDDAANGQIVLNATASGGSGYPGTVYTPIGGGADDTANLQAILNGFEAAGGGELIIAGRCYVTGLTYRGGNLTIRGLYASSQFALYGCGFTNTSTSTTTLDFSTAGLSTPALTNQNILVQDLVFYASNAMTGGWAIKGGTTFSCSSIVRCTVFGSNYGYPGGHKNGVYLGMGCQDVSMNKTFVWMCPGSGIETEGYESNSTDAGAGTTYYFHECFVAGCTHGLRYKHKDAIHATSCDFVLNYVTNVFISPDISDTPSPYQHGNNQLAGFFHGCFFDNNGVTMTGYANNKIIGMRFMSCWFYTEGVRVNDHCIDTRIANNIFVSGSVWIASGALHTAVTNNTFLRPSTIGSVAVVVAAGACDFEIIGNKFTYDTQGGAANGAVTGVSFGGSNDRFVHTLNVTKSVGGTPVSSTGTPGGTQVYNTNNFAWSS